LANCVQGITVDALLDCFLSGLKIDIQRDVVAQNPTSLLSVVSLAKLFEEKYLPKEKTPLTHPYLKYQPSSLAQTTKSTSLPPLLPNPNTIHRPNQQSVKFSNIKKNISTVEMQLRREKGLCFMCDAKFSPSHRCPNKQCLLLQLEKEDFKLEPDPPDEKVSIRFNHGNKNITFLFMLLREPPVLVLCDFKVLLMG